MKKRSIGCLVLFSVLLAGCGGGEGGSGALDTTPKTVNLSWAANRESTVNAPGGGYRVYHSATSGFAPGGAGVSFIDVPYVSGATAPTSTSVELPPGAYYFRVVAYSAFGGGAQSAPSSQLRFFVY